MRNHICGWIGTIAFLFVAIPADARELRIIAWNIEAGFSEESELSTIIAGMRDLGRADIWGLSEVTAAWTEELSKAAGQHYHAELGTQSTDRLLILVNLNRFAVIRSTEIRSHRPTSGRRPPLVVTLRERATGTEFAFVVNHFTRGEGDDPRRTEESVALRRWAEQSRLPIIAAGDFNFDWSIHDFGRTRSRAFDALIEDNIFVWSVPTEIRSTQCSTAFYSILDMVFVAGEAKLWPHETQIINTPCVDNDSTADHRPVEMTIELPDQ